MIKNPVARVEAASSVMAFAQKYLSCSAGVTGCGGEQTTPQYQRYEERTSECPGGYYSASTGDVNINVGDGATLNAKIRNTEQSCAFNKCVPSGTLSLQEEVGPHQVVVYKAGEITEAVKGLGLTESGKQGQFHVQPKPRMIPATGVDVYALDFTKGANPSFHGVSMWPDHRAEGAPTCVPIGLTQERVKTQSGYLI